MKRPGPMPSKRAKRARSEGAAPERRPLGDSRRG